ncbi:MAG: tryptophanase [Bacteriovoracia bacterium]
MKEVKPQSKFKTIIEPFRIKTVEPIKMISREERQAKLKGVDYNLFLLKAEDILIDLLTDSGTSAMSSAQWGKLMDGDESYAGCRSYYDFEKVIKRITGFKHIFPTHQGRAAERILFSSICDHTKAIPNNTHFDTTRANIEFNGTEAVDLVIDEGKIPSLEHPFKGNIDTVKLETFIKEKGVENIPVVMLTITNNSGGGQPVSMANIRETKKICKKYGLPLFLDACRFAENAYFIKTREDGYANISIEEICKEMFSYADGCTMSAKKDALVNIGGFLALNDDEWAVKIKNLGILTEGYPTYGGLAGRDLAALAQGLEEILDEDYLQYRIISTQYLGNALIKNDIPVIRPIGGHAVYIDAKTMLNHIPVNQFPGQALACELYLEGGIRSCEIGSVMFGKKNSSTGEEIPAAMELVRLAIPRRVYTQSHIDYVIEVICEVNKNKKNLGGIKITKEPLFLRHFSAGFAPV